MAASESAAGGSRPKRSRVGSARPALLTKILVPRRRDRTVVRRRLLDALHRGLDHRVQLVVAPAGYGKTTLLVEFAHEARTAGVPVCWLTLDEHECDARSFFEHLVLSVRERFGSFGRRTGAQLRNAGNVARLREVIVTTFCNELAETVPEFFVLVLDDFHLVHGSPVVNQAVDQLIRQLPPGVHVVLASRIIPTQLNLVGLASRLELTGLGTADMRFRPAEAAELVRRHAGPDLSDRDVSRLVQRAEGWVTAMVLSLHGGSEGSWSALSGSRSRAGEPAYAYMATQVFEQLPPGLQRFLLESAVLTELSAEECDAVLERCDSAQLLDDLLQRGLFVEPLEASAGEPASAASRADAAGAPWLRYHGLWREFLLDRLASQDARRLGTLHRRAARRALARDDVAAGVEHLNRAGNPAQVARTLLTVAGGEVAAGHAERLLAWIVQLPETALQERPQLLVHAARALRRLDRLSEALETLERAERFAAGAREWETVYLARASRAVLVALRGEPDAAVALVTDLFDQVNRHPRSAALRVHLGREACQVLGIAGRDREAISHGAAALTHIAAIRGGRDRQLAAATITHTLGVCEDRLGNSAAAARWYARAQEHWRALGDDVNQVRVLNQMGKLHQRAGRLEEATAALQESLALVERTGHLSTHAGILNNLAGCERERGRLSAAFEAAEHAVALARQGQESVVLGDGLLEAALLRLRMGHTADAIPVLEEARTLAEERWPAGRSFTHALLALAHARSGQRTAASLALVEARRALAVTTPTEARLRTCVALAAAAEQPAQTVRQLRQTRRWARDRSLVARFFTEAAQYRETAQLMLQEKRLPPEAAAALRAAVESDLYPRTGGLTLHAIVTPASPGTEGASDGMRGSRGTRQRTYEAFELRLFGMPTLLRDGADSGTWRTKLVRDLLCFLALRSDSLVRTETLVDSLLPDAEFERGVTAIRHAMYHLRRLFVPLDPVRTVRGGYRLLRHPEIRCDLIEFETLLSRATAPHADTERRRVLREAIALYRGPLLEGVAGEWTDAPRAAAESQMLGALQRLLVLYEQTSSHEDAVWIARQALGLDPFQEGFHVAVIRNLVALGQVSQAVTHYRQYDRIMREELGRGPHPDATRMLGGLLP